MGFFAENSPYIRSILLYMARKTLKVRISIDYVGIPMGDGRYYEPCEPKDTPNKKAIAEISKIFEESLKESRKKREEKAS